MRASHIKVSLVIPAYNEEDHLRACLDAIAKQTVKPFEVIVVDNNSTDATAAIARSYPFVRLLHESRRGVVYARDTGFNAAKGDIIGRIDVDTRVSVDWIATVQHIFNETELGAITGAVGYYDAPFKPIFDRTDLFFRRWVARRLAARDELFLYGANMAVRKSLWRQLRGEVCHLSAMHEDIDLGAHAAHRARCVAFRPELQAYISGRRIDSNTKSFWLWVVANGRVYKAHGLKGRFYMYPIELLALVSYPVLRIIYRGHDVSTGRFSVSRMFRASGQARISPVSETPYL